MALITDTYTGTADFIARLLHGGETLIVQQPFLEIANNSTLVDTTFIGFSSVTSRNSRIVSVSLSLNTYDDASAGSKTILTKYLATSINESMSYNTAMALTGISLDTVIINSEPNDWAPIELTQNGASNFLVFTSGTCSPSFRLQVPSNSSTALFYSRRGGYAPKLTVIWDTGPNVPSVIYPVGAATNKSQPIKFEWTYLSESGGVQSAYTLQWRAKGTTSWNIITQTTANTYYTFPANTFSTGYVEWQVKTADIISQYSEYSPIAEFYAIGQPDAPIIEVMTSPRPIITWGAELQKLWELQILQESAIVYEVGTDLSGALFSHTVAQYLNDGTYLARVRIQNSYGYWSAWGERTFIISTTKPTAPTLSVISNYDTGLRLSVSYVTPQCVIYRRELGESDYYSIASLTGEKEHTDYTVASDIRYEYFARAVDTDNSFADSESVNGSIILQYTYIADINNLANSVELKLRFDNAPGREHSYTKNKQYTSFVGREYPAQETDGTKDHTLSLSYFVKADQYKSIMDLVDADIVLYRNQLGLVIYGSISNVTQSERFYGSNKGYLISFAIRKVDYIEGGEHA